MGYKARAGRQEPEPAARAGAKTRSQNREPSRELRARDEAWSRNWCR